MKTQTIVFIGPPGSGKGTQSTRIADFISENSDEKTVLEIDVGELFRNMSKLSDFTESHIDKQMQAGKLLPTFISAHLWANKLLQDLTSDDHLVLGGSPRRILEAKLFDEAVAFYRRQQPIIIHVHIDKPTSIERLTDRGRTDDQKEAIRTRWRQYKQDTLPVVEWYQNNAGYRYERIDGERSRDIIQQDIRNILSDSQ